MTSDAGTPRVDGGEACRTEHDLLGEREVPQEVYYGIHTLRATENFAATGMPISAHPYLVRGLAAVKQAAAEANRELGLLEPVVADAIVAACQEVYGGALAEQFVVDVVQGGAGTSSNMNANEVIANRALEILGERRGDYGRVHPLEHVNLGQSTNDVYPTAVKVGLRLALHDLDDSVRHLADAFSAKATEFASLVKIGRTQLQDAVPMTLGQEFGSYAVMLEEDRERLREVGSLLAEVNLGGTAIGTGINADPGYRSRACTALERICGIPVVPAHDLIEATQDVGVFVQLSGVLKRTALKLSKICNDLRLLSSGPRAGLNEINLPAVQAGSSIMPGKVNPVIPEFVNQIAFQVIGDDVTISCAAEAGQLQLNAFEPVIAHCLFSSVRHMAIAGRALADRCVAGITANEERLEAYVRESVGVVAALNPYLGYTTSTVLAQEALVSGRSVQELVLEQGLLDAGQIAEILRPGRLAQTTQPAEP